MLRDGRRPRCLATRSAIDLRVESQRSARLRSQAPSLQKKRRRVRLAVRSESHYDVSLLFDDTCYHIVVCLPANVVDGGDVTE